LVNSQTLIENWEASLCHANANYQMVVMAELTKGGIQSLENLQIALAKANKGKTAKFFGKGHRVFEVLIKKGMIKPKQTPQGLYFILNTPPTVENMALIKVSAIKARKSFEVSHK
jgi:hypothetical protein